MRVKSNFALGRQKRLFCPQSVWGQIVLSVAFALVLLILGAVSIFDTDKTVSLTENRNLATRPEFSLTALFKESYTSDFDTYYADTFPLRDWFLSVNKKTEKVFAQTKGSDDIVLVSKQDKDDFAGQAID